MHMLISAIIMFGWLALWIGGAHTHSESRRWRRRMGKMWREQTPEMVAEYRERRIEMARRAQELHDDDSF